MGLIPDRRLYDKAHTMKRFFISLLLSAGLLNAAESKPPNIIVILADDLGFGDLGCYGADFKTPAIDELAAEGVRCTNMILPANVCSPSRAAILTGRYPMRNGHPFYRYEGGNYGLDPAELTIPELLKPVGYRSLAVGKWHLGIEFEGSHPLDAGFDEFLGIKSNYAKSSGKKAKGQKKGNAPALKKAEGFDTDTLFRGKEVEEKNVVFQTLTTRYTDEVVSFIEKQKDGPFFIYMAHNIAHTPILPSKRFKGTTKKGPYCDFVSELDHSVGRVLKAVGDAKLDENTLIVFLSDNGPTTLGSAGPLLGGKYVTTEGGHRVPAIFRWTGKISAGEVCDTMISSMDLLPVFCELAGVPLPTDRKIDGANILDILKGNPSNRPTSFSTTTTPPIFRQCVRVNGSCIFPGQLDDQPYWAKSGKGKPLLTLDHNILIDLESDVGEKINVADQHPEVVALLLKEADRIRVELGDVGKPGKDQRPGWPPAAETQRLPNVVFIFADDLGYGDLGCYGATKVNTPNIDKLAAEGRRFTDAHSASAVCTPSRYGLLTGEYPFRADGGKGIWGPAPIDEPLLIDTETLTIADIFKSQGYDTAVIGKWHLGFGKGKNDWKEPLRPGPQDLGFDYYFGMPVVNSAPPYVYVENDRIVGSDPADPLVYLGKNSEEKVTPLTPIPKEAAQRSANVFGGAVEAHKMFNDYEVGTKLAGKATDWIKSRGEKPFFLYFSTTNVHHPFTPAKRFQGTSEAGLYGDFVHELDWIVGEVMETLEAQGVADNTLFIFTSDNGGMFNHGGRHAAELGHKINGDLLGSKFGIWEGGHRVPFIAWWPGKIEAGTESHQLLNSVDMLASFAALTGRELGADEKKDSINMLPALTGNPDQPLRTEMIETPHRPTHMSLRKGKWMYIPAQSDGGFKGSKPNHHAWGGAAVAELVHTPNSDIVDGKIRKDAPPAQLYDLEADVNQTKNLYHEYPEVVREMSAELATYASAKAAANEKKKRKK